MPRLDWLMVLYPSPTGRIVRVKPWTYFHTSFFVSIERWQFYCISEHVIAGLSHRDALQPRELTFLYSDDLPDRLSASLASRRNRLPTSVCAAAASCGLNPRASLKAEIFSCSSPLNHKANEIQHTTLCYSEQWDSGQSMEHVMWANQQICVQRALHWTDSSILRACIQSLFTWASQALIPKSSLRLWADESQTLKITSWDIGQLDMFWVSRAYYTGPCNPKRWPWAAEQKASLGRAWTKTDWWYKEFCALHQQENTYFSASVVGMILSM